MDDVGGIMKLGPGSGRTSARDSADAGGAGRTGATGGSGRGGTGTATAGKRGLDSSVSGAPKRARRRPDAAASTKGGKKTKGEGISHVIKDKDKARAAKYLRGKGVSHRPIQDKKLKALVKRNEETIHRSAASALSSEILLPSTAGFLEAEDDMERTYKFKQMEIKEAVDLGVSRKIFDLNLDTYGPYRCSYSRSGRHMVLAGRKGHVAMVDFVRFSVSSELNLGETVRDACFLHDQSMFAVAQRKHVYIYDRNGVEIHRLRSHIEPQALQFLPYHFLLASVGSSGYLKYQDTSTGNLVCEHRTRLGSCSVMRANPYNAVMCLGHSNGTVTMWTPNMSTPVVKLLSHRGPVKSIAIDLEGRYMATSGLDSRIKVWDIRKFEELHDYFSTTPAVSLDISQRNLLAVGYGSHVQVWKDALHSKAKAPYMRHEIPGNLVENVAFQPFEDTLAIGHANGLSSMVVPGSGEPNYDSLEADPFMSKTGRRERVVHALLDKIQPDLIALNPSQVGQVDKATDELRKKEKEERLAASRPVKEERIIKKGRGRKTRRSMKKKQLNVVTAGREALRAKLERERGDKKAPGALEDSAVSGGGSGGSTSALNRFFTNK